MTVSETDLDVRNDGKDHVRIGMAGRTLIGRLLANEALTPFRHPRYGHFSSMEAYWAFVKSGMSNPDLRALSGDRAVRETHAVPKISTRLFRKLICEGLEIKVETHLQLRTLLAYNELDFVRYEVIDGEPMVDTNQAWFLTHLNKFIRERRAAWR